MYELMLACQAICQGERLPMFCMKTIFGGQLSTRHFEAQQIEARFRCPALNVMTSLGMPVNYLVKLVIGSGMNVLEPNRFLFMQ